MRCYLTIHTESELCVSDGGEIWDADTALDRFGIPVLRGSRLRGLLRAACEELVMLGAADMSEVQTLFGSPDMPGLLTVQDAHPAGYPQQLAALQEGRITAQAILEKDTVVRVCSGFDENGTASRIRMVRAVRRGMTFLGVCDCPEEQLPLLQRALPLLRRMGLGRTRGMGKVTCRMADPAEIAWIMPESAPFPADAGAAVFTLDLLSPLAADEAIPGSMLRGAWRRRIGAAADGLQCSFAHPEADGMAAWPVPGFLAAPKRSAFSGDPPQRQLFAPDLTNAADDPSVIPLRSGLLAADAAFTELRMPVLHRGILIRHEQDAPGRPAHFFRIRTLSEGQRLTGRIGGDPALLQAVADSLRKDPLISLGRGRHAGLGLCRMALQPLPEMPSCVTDTAAVWLGSPAVLLDDNAMYQCRPELFRFYLELLLPPGIRIAQELGRWVRYADIAPRHPVCPAFRAYAGGTVFLYRFTSAFDLAALAGRRIGEMTADGFGEFRIIPADRLNRASFTAVQTVSAIPVCAPYLREEEEHA